MQARRDFRSEIEDQAAAGASGFTDALTLGTADYAGALTGAAFGRGKGLNFMDRYRSILAAKKAQDAYDAQHFPIARTAGLTAGTGLLIVASDGVATPAAAARLAPQTIRLAGSTVRPAMQWARVTGTASGVGAGVGLGSQVAASLVRDLPSTMPELVGATTGGAFAGPATLFRGPGIGAGVDSLVNHATQAALLSKPLDWSAIQRDAAIGAAVGFVGGRVASGEANQLTPVVKGNLGERLSRAKSEVRGDKIIGKNTTFKDGGRTRADLILEGLTPETPRGVEAKFGPSATLSYAQRYAQRMLRPKDRYHVDHWLPQDVAKGIGGLLGVSTSQASSNRNVRR